MKCQRAYFQDPSVGYLDLCLDDRPGSGPLQQELFRSPVTAFLYERGWRNNFQTMGYPLKEEVKLVMDYFQTYPKEPQVLVDVSCGTGYVTRRLAKSGKYFRVVGIDLSENMLKEAYRRMDGDNLFTLIRANVVSLPLKENVVDFVYCGAALHCWPKVQDGLAEMYRILQPDGLVFATTFISNYPPAMSRWNSYRFFTKKELEWLFKSRGFRKVQVQVLKSPTIFQMVQSAVVRCCK